MKTFREQLMSIVNSAADEYDAKANALAGKAASMIGVEDAIKRREDAMAERETTVQNRENAVGQVRTVAANRLGEITALKAQLKISDDHRKAAFVEARLAREEKARLEGVVIQLIADKKTLQAQLSIIHAEVTGNARMGAGLLIPEHNALVSEESVVF